jgi:hypothetical protein
MRLDALRRKPVIVESLLIVLAAHVIRDALKLGCVEQLVAPLIIRLLHRLIAFDASLRVPETFVGFLVATPRFIKPLESAQDFAEGA